MNKNTILLEIATYLVSDNDNIIVEVDTDLELPNGILEQIVFRKSKEKKLRVLKNKEEICQILIK